MLATTKALQVVNQLRDEGISMEELRRQIFASKAKYRSHLAKAPILEKLRILEEMRDFTASLKQSREENKARVRAAWASPEAK